uniref:Uncharacterized protein n=1 Tax=Methanococcus maripaludis (strain C6 / ATCC BAA-1332) TaxID=444158 RepID=A9A7H5_METM6
MKTKYILILSLAFVLIFSGCTGSNDTDSKTSDGVAAVSSDPVVVEEPEFILITDDQITEFKELMAAYGPFEYEITQNQNNVNIALRYPDKIDEGLFVASGKMSILLLMSVSNDTEPYGNVVKSINNYQIKIYQNNHTLLGGAKKLADSEEIEWDIPQSARNLWFKESEDTAWELLGDYTDSSDAILQITTDPYLTGSDKWLIMHAYISDDWYYLEDYQKKRVAKNIGDSITLILYESGVVENGAALKIHIHDSYGTEVAENSLWTGEYTIYE